MFQSQFSFAIYFCQAVCVCVCVCVCVWCVCIGTCLFLPTWQIKCEDSKAFSVSRTLIRTFNCFLIKKILFCIGVQLINRVVL